MRVAAGVEDLTFSVQPKSEWDICDGVALLAATAKVYSRFDGNPVKFNQMRPRITSGAVDLIDKRFLLGATDGWSCGG